MSYKPDVSVSYTVSSGTYYSPEEFDEDELIDDLTSLLWGRDTDDRTEKKAERCRWKTIERRHERRCVRLPRKPKEVMLWLR